MDDYPDEAMVSTSEVAGELGVNVATVRRWIKRGELPATWIGGPIGSRVRVADVRAFLARRSAERYGTPAGGDDA